MFETLVKRFGKTKFVWCFMIFVASVVFVATGTMAINEWKELAIWLTGLIVGGNVGTKAVHAFAKNPKESSA